MLTEQRDKIIDDLLLKNPKGPTKNHPAEPADEVVQHYGYKKIVWDGKNSKGISVSPGVYFYKAELGPLIETKKMTLIK